MRIAFLSTFYPFRGGIAQYNADLYSAFQQAGHEVKAFTFTCQYPSFLFPGKTQFVTPEDSAKPIDSVRILNSANPISYFRTAKAIAGWKPDVLVMKYWMSYFAPSLGTVARILRKKGVKVVTSLDNVIPHEPKFFDKPFSRYFLKSNDACVVMARSVKEDMQKLAPEVPVELFPHPVYNHFGAAVPKEEARQRLGIRQDLKTLLAFGLIRDYKGLDILLDAMGKLDDSYQLLIAGECYGDFGRYASKIEELRSAWKASGRDWDRIKVFNRYISDSEVPDFFCAADLNVLPYRSATQSGITAISLHFGLPAVATPVGGLPECIGEMGIGIMAREVSPEAVAESVEEFFAQPSEKFTDAIEHMKRTATWPALVEKMINLVA